MKTTLSYLTLKQEAQLVRAAQSGSARARSEAFDRLRDAFGPLIRKHSCRIQSVRWEADDVLQELWIAFWKAVQRFDCRRGARLATYAAHFLDGVVRRLWREAVGAGGSDICQTDLRPHESGLCHEAVDHSAAFEDRVLARLTVTGPVRRLVRSLTPSLRRVTRLRFWHDKTGAETARALRVSRAFISKAERRVMLLGQQRLRGLELAAEARGDAAAN